MRRLKWIAGRASARFYQTFSSNPLFHPLGRASDKSIDEALTVQGLERSDLFTLGTTFAPHRHRFAAMLLMQGLAPTHIAKNYWHILKGADHRCAYCLNTKRCESWLGWGRYNDAPKMFCLNAAAFERMKAN
jgi:hypothetical protein